MESTERGWPRLPKFQVLGTLLGQLEGSSPGWGGFGLFFFIFFLFRLFFFFLAFLFCIEAVFNIDAGPHNFFFFFCSS